MGGGGFRGILGEVLSGGFRHYSVYEGPFPKPYRAFTNLSSSGGIRGMNSYYQADVISLQRKNICAATPMSARRKRDRTHRLLTARPYGKVVKRT